MQAFVAKKLSVDPSQFDSIADLLLNQTCLFIKAKPYRIVEIEFYHHSKEHPDQYVHCNSDQLNYATWYFHKYKNGTYKGGTWKGMDLALGNESKELAKQYSGILIRAIYNLTTQKVIEGPCRVVNHILETCQCSDLVKLTKNQSLSVLKNEHDFVIQDFNFDKMPLYTASRVGLSDKYFEYRDKKYRYTILPKVIKREKSNFELVK